MGKGQIAPQIIEKGHELYKSENTIDVPVELLTAFTNQSITRALRDHCGIPSSETGSFIVEIEKTKTAFCLDNIFTTKSCTFLGQDLPKVRAEFYNNPRIDRVWFCHLDLSRTTDSTGIALGYVDSWMEGRPQIAIAGLLEVKPTSGNVIPWEAIIHFLYRLSKIIPLYGVTADQVAHNYLREHLVPYGYKIAKVSDTPNSAIYHEFIDLLSEGRLKVANHQKALDELLALNVDEKTGKVTKPANGSKDCADALVSLVSLLRKLPSTRHNPENWVIPKPPEMEQLPNGQYRILNPKTVVNTCTLTLI